ncbi:MAG: hypothetical protein J6U54_09590 [Clostridiales bacterium]|nr:hypothetical protein [Clostridiales bacterium]
MAVTNSVLNTIKEMLGPSQLYEGFDTDIIVDINSVLMGLAQMGIVEEGTKITDENDVWSDVIGDRTDLEAIKTYIYIKVKLLFDTPSNSTVIQELEKHATEYEWRMYAFSDVVCQPGGYDSV